MATQSLDKYVALSISAEHIGTVLSGKLGTDVALVLDDPTPTVPDAQYTNFALDTYASGGGAHPISLWKRMTFDDLKQLLTALEREHHLPPTLDEAAFKQFIKAIKHELTNQPSSRFTEARFGDIAKDAGGAIVAHLGLGIDMVGTVHDSRGAISFEQHVVPMHPGSFKRLSKADRLSLAAAIQVFLRTAPPAVSPLWLQLAQDAGK